ncbi:hypothetical protein BV22DRAFT_1123145 [Leucogyrophana mollusca]|uniref:Uncharacterized protein n=1 Tax=Leucogyrophana mollusca TaxID=85980 RepID=A0ACB8B3K2_9AGAM|nr:hypothetical protein BV22DRAFT_1123145 [Leucogyrophana mollusca]
MSAHPWVYPPCGNVATIAHTKENTIAVLPVLAPVSDSALGLALAVKAELTSRAARDRVPNLGMFVEHSVEFRECRAGENYHTRYERPRGPSGGLAMSRVQNNCFIVGFERRFSSPGFTHRGLRLVREPGYDDKFSEFPRNSWALQPRRLSAGDKADNDLRREVAVVQDQKYFTAGPRYKYDESIVPVRYDTRVSDQTMIVSDPCGSTRGALPPPKILLFTFELCVPVVNLQQHLPVVYTGLPFLEVHYLKPQMKASKLDGFCVPSGRKRRARQFRDGLAITVHAYSSAHVSEYNARTIIVASILHKRIICMLRYMLGGGVSRDRNTIPLYRKHDGDVGSLPGRKGSEKWAGHGGNALGLRVGEKRWAEGNSNSVASGAGLRENVVTDDAGCHTLVVTERLTYRGTWTLDWGMSLHVMR